jgi:hypothetical protein
VSVVTVQRLGRGRNFCFVIHPNLLRIDPCHLAWRGYASPFMTLCCGRTDRNPAPVASVCADDATSVRAHRHACSPACGDISADLPRVLVAVVALSGHAQARIRLAFDPRREPSACRTVRTPRVSMRSNTSLSAPDVSSVNASPARSVSPSLCVMSLASDQSARCAARGASSSQSEPHRDTHRRKRSEAGERYCGLGSAREDGASQEN